jgi:hypothetical protein
MLGKQDIRLFTYTLPKTTKLSRCGQYHHTIMVNFNNKFVKQWIKFSHLKCYSKLKCP